MGKRRHPGGPSQKQSDGSRVFVLLGNAMNKYLIEFLGTFFLALTVALCALTPSITLTPVIAGFVLLVMIYAGGHISGAHYNPAVTVAVLVRGKTTVKDAIPYIGAQLVAAGAAAGTALFLKPGAVIAAADSFKTGPVIVSEILFTFLLAFVVLQVATAKNLKNNPFYGAAIGLTVAGGAFASGAIMNPAVATMLGVVGLVKWDELVWHIAGELIGGGAAAGIFMLTNAKEDFAKE